MKIRVFGSGAQEYFLATPLRLILATQHVHQLYDWKEIFAGAQMKIFTILFAGLLLAACGETHPLETLEPGETGRVVRILDGDTIALNTGLVVKLASLEAPSFGRGEDPDQTYAKESARILEDLCLGRRVQLHYPGLTRDRYDRAIAHVSTLDDLGPDLWINQEAARRGAARVRVYPDTAALAEALLAAEQDAQLERAGMWSKRDYNGLSPLSITADFRGFAVIEAATLGSPLPGGQYAHCRYSVEGAGMLIEMTRDAEDFCALPSGTSLRVRGYVRGGRMDVTHPLNLTLIDQSS